VGAAILGVVALSGAALTGAILKLVQRQSAGPTTQVGDPNVKSHVETPGTAAPSAASEKQDVLDVESLPKVGEPTAARPAGASSPPRAARKAPSEPSQAAPVKSEPEAKKEPESKKSAKAEPAPPPPAEPSSPPAKKADQPLKKVLNDPGF
jgi:hypothetical protein